MCKKQYISVIIPAYNVDKYIEACLDSIIAQTYNELEILVINDGSTDTTFDKIRQYANNDKRIKIINHEQNKGNGIGRNEAIKQANGDYILFVDSDDTIEKNTIEILLHKALEDDSDAVIYGHRQIAIKRGKERSNIEFLPDRELAQMNREDLYTRFLLQKSGLFIQPWKYFVKRSVLIENNIEFDSSGIYFEDIIYSSKLLFFINKLSVIERSLYNYYTRKGSITKTWTRKTIESRFAAIISLREFLKEQNVFDKFKDAYKLFFITTGFLRSYTDYVRMKNRDEEVEDFLFNISCSDFIKYFNIAQINIPKDLLKNKDKYDIDYYDLFRMVVYLRSCFKFAIRYGRFLQKVLGRS